MNDWHELALEYASSNLSARKVRDKIEEELGISLKEHGEPKTGYNNFWITLLAAAIQFGILYKGGFFS